MVHILSSLEELGQRDDVYIGLFVPVRPPPYGILRIILTAEAKKSERGTLSEMYSVHPTHQPLQG